MGARQRRGARLEPRRGHSPADTTTGLLPSRTVRNEISVVLCHGSPGAYDVRTVARRWRSDPGSGFQQVSAPLSHPVHNHRVPYLLYRKGRGAEASCVLGGHASGSPPSAHVPELPMTSKVSSVTMTISVFHWYRDHDPHDFQQKARGTNSADEWTPRARSAVRAEGGPRAETGVFPVLFISLSVPAA